MSMISMGVEAPLAMKTDAHRVQPELEDLLRVVDEMDAGLLAAGQLEEMAGVGARPRADDQDAVGLLGLIADLLLPLGRRAADGVLEPDLRNDAADGVEDGLGLRADERGLDDDAGLADAGEPLRA